MAGSLWLHLHVHAQVDARTFMPISHDARQKELMKRKVRGARR
jgi:hypothetical protein